MSSESNTRQYSFDPRHPLRIASPRPLEEARARLRAAIDPEGGRWYLRARAQGRTLAGGEQGEEWTLTRFVPYPDPWRPRITLRLRGQGDGTLAEAELGWTPGGRRAARLWSVTCFLLAALISATVATRIILPTAMLLSIMALLYAPLPWLDLWFEARATRRLLERVLG